MGVKGRVGARTYLGPAGRGQDTQFRMRVIRRLTKSTMQPCGSNGPFSTPWNWSMVRIALLYESVSRIVQKTTGGSRKEQTLTTHRALSDPTASHTSMIRCSSGREAAVSCQEDTRHLRKMQRMGGAIEHAGKAGSGARQKRKYVCCGSMWCKMAAYTRA